MCNTIRGMRTLKSVIWRKITRVRGAAGVAIIRESLSVEKFGTVQCKDPQRITALNPALPHYNPFPSSCFPSSASPQAVEKTHPLASPGSGYLEAEESQQTKDDNVRILKILATIYGTYIFQDEDRENKRPARRQGSGPFLKPSPPDSRSRAPSYTTLPAGLGGRRPALDGDRRLCRGASEAPSTPSPGGLLPRPLPARAGSLRRRNRARAGLRGRGSAAGALRSPGRPRRRPLPDARRGRDAICGE